MDRPRKEINGEVALAVPEKDGEFLIVERSQENTSSGKWVFPGGKIEDGESPKEAALRELSEETALTGEAERQGESYIGEGELGYWKMYPFHVRVSSKSVELDYEHSDHKWVTMEKLKVQDTMGELKSLKALDII